MENGAFRGVLVMGRGVGAETQAVLRTDELAELREVQGTLQKGR